MKRQPRTRTLASPLVHAVVTVSALLAAIAVPVAAPWHALSRPAPGTVGHSVTRAGTWPRPAGEATAPAPHPPATRRALSADQAGSVWDLAVRLARGHVAVAAADLAGGAALVRGDTNYRFVAASITKVDILAALLLERQDQGRAGLTTVQRALAATMIENSDNTAANALFRQAGGAGGLTAANWRFGLAHTSVTGPRWGLSRTTATDQLQLLRTVFGNRSVLSPASRAFIQDLMGQVEPDQAWGVSAAAPGAPAALKNGWLPRPDGTWSINSIGRITRAGHTLLIAVLSDGNPDQDTGTALTEAAARAAALTLIGA